MVNILMFFISSVMLYSSIFYLQHATAWVFDFWLPPFVSLFLSLCAWQYRQTQTHCCLCDSEDFVLVWHRNPDLSVCVRHLLWGRKAGVRFCSKAELLIKCLMSACSEGRQRFLLGFNLHTPDATYAAISYCTSKLQVYGWIIEKSSRQGCF